MLSGRCGVQCYGEERGCLGTSPNGCEIAVVFTMRRKREQSPAEGEFLVEIDPEPLDECVTAWGGLPLFVRTIRSLDVPGSVKRNLHLKQRRRGPDEPSYVESFLVLNAGGGECLEDFAHLREDAGVAAMVG